MRFDAYLPVPASGSTCGLLVPVSVRAMDAGRAPAALGENVTEMVQVAPAARLVLQVFVCEKSPGFDPPRTMLVVLTDTFSLFVTVTTLTALLVPTLTCPKARLAGIKPTGSTPVPRSVTICGLLGALSVMVIDPLWAPVAVGAKVTTIEHCEFAARVAPQLLI